MSWDVTRPRSCFDPTEVTRLYASPEFSYAVDDLSDPDAIVNAVLAIHKARRGGSDSILDTAAALITEDKAADEGTGTYEYVEVNARSRFAQYLPLSPNHEPARGEPVGQGSTT